jgi:predicted RNA binding protein YcfA (HicA-like mRNA interferase family)
MSRLRRERFAVHFRKCLFSELCPPLEIVGIRVYSVRMKARDVIRALEADGWREERSKGSNRHFRHSTKPGTVTVAVHGGSDLKRQDIASIERQAGLKLRKD